MEAVEVVVMEEVTLEAPGADVVEVVDIRRLVRAGAAQVAGAVLMVARQEDADSQAGGRMEVGVGQGAAAGVGTGHRRRAVTAPR